MPCSTTQAEETPPQFVSEQFVPARYPAIFENTPPLQLTYRPNDDIFREPTGRLDVNEHRYHQSHNLEDRQNVVATKERNIEPKEDLQPDPPPDGGWPAWTQVFASFLINMNVYGLVNAFGEFQHFYETEFLTTYSSSTISWIGTVQGSLTLFVGMLAGPIFDRGYFKLTLIVSSIMLVFSWMMLSLSTEFYQVMLTQGVLAGICVGLMEVPSIALIPDFFRYRLGLALGLAVSGAPVGGLVYSAVFRAVLTATNFQWATRVIGFINLVTLGLAVSIIKPLDAKRRSKSRRLFDLSALREGTFICFLFDAFFAYCAALIPYFITPAFAASLGGSSTNANYLITVLNAAQVVGRIVPAFLSDYYGGSDMLLIAQAVIGLLGLHWITIATLGGFIEFLILTGFMSGAVATLPATVIPYLSPSPETLGTRIGTTYAVAGIGVLIGNPIALATTGNNRSREDYLGAQLWMGMCALIGAAFFIPPSISIKKNRSYILGENSGIRKLRWNFMSRRHTRTPKHHRWGEP